MPISKYFGGHGEKVMDHMRHEYGDKKGKQVFYATANNKKKKGMRERITELRMAGKLTKGKGK